MNFTYTHSRSFGPYAIPISMQTIYIRNYCMSVGLDFSLPQTENPARGSYLVLLNFLDLITTQKQVSAVIIASSIYMFQELPSDLPLLESLDINNIEIHCPLEKFKGSFSDLFSYVRIANDFDSLADHSPLNYASM